MNDQRVEAYVASLEDVPRAIVGRLRELVRSAAPGATESFKWAQPVYEQGGPFCWIKAHRAHVTLGFWRGMQLRSGDGLLEGSGSKMAHLKLRSESDIQPAVVHRLVREAVALNRERGDPTKGG